MSDTPKPVELKLDANYHLKEIETDVLAALRKAQQDYLRNSNGRRLNTWHVSDFVSECLRKTHYGKLYPEKFDVNKSSIFFLGHKKISWRFFRRKFLNSNFVKLREYMFYFKTFKMESYRLS